MKTTIAKKEGVSNLFTVTIADMSAGQILAMQRALDKYGIESTVANGVGVSLFQGMTESEDLQKYLAENRVKA